MKKWCGCKAECAHPERCNPHCPHDVAGPYVRDQHDIRCCHCGIKGLRTVHYTQEPGHGPYAAETHRASYYEWKEGSAPDGL